MTLTEAAHFMRVNYSVATLPLSFQIYRTCLLVGDKTGEHFEKKKEKSRFRKNKREN